MKNLKPLTTFLCILWLCLNKLANAQLNVNCQNAEQLITHSNEANDRFGRSVVLTESQKYYKFTAPVDGVIIAITSSLAGSGRFVNSIELYKGKVCNQMMSVAKDSITPNSNDSLLEISLNGLLPDDTLLLLVSTQLNGNCQPCLNSEALFRLSIDFIASPQELCTTCIEVPGCNLVCNGNFEQFNTLTASLDYNISEACGWANLTTGSVDYFNSSNSNPQLTVPCNIFGTENPHSGNGYAGFSAEATDPNTNPQGYAEYLKTRLLGELIAGQTYTVSFSLSLAEGYRCTSNNIGLYFYETLPASINTSSSAPITGLVAPQINVSGNSIPLNGWQTFTFTYTPTVSGIRWLVIGNFTTAFTTVGCSPFSCDNTCPNKDASYYYIDDISVIGKARAGTTILNGCDGRLETLTTTLSPPVQWYNGSTATSTTAMGANPSVPFYVTSTAGGCEVEELFYIWATVQPDETIAYTPLNSTVCAGEMVTLTASGLSSGNYYWRSMPPPGTGTTNSQSVTFTAPAANSYGDILYGYSPNGCMIHTNWSIDVIDGIQNLTTSSTDLCIPGQCVTLSANATNTSVFPIVYNWSNGQTGQNITVCPQETSTYTVSASLSGTTCSSSTTTALAQLLSAPELSISENLITTCSQSATTYSVAIAGTYTSVNWSVFPIPGSGNAIEVTGGYNNPIININWNELSQDAVITATVFNGPCSSTISYTVNACCRPHGGYKNIQGGSDNTSPIIISNATSPTSGGTNANGFSIFSGYYSIAPGSTVTWTNIGFVMSPGTKITIPTGATLVLENCHFFACTKMWDGIYVNGGTLIVNGLNLFEDAQNAIVLVTSNIQNFGKLYFNKCHIGIDVRSSPTANLSNIVQNTFTSRNFQINVATPNLPSAYLNQILVVNYPGANYTYYPSALTLSPYPSSRGHIGINITDNSTVTIGTSSPDPSKRNVFDNLVYGIHAEKSNITVLNNLFIRIQENCNGVIGLCKEVFTLEDCPAGTSVCVGQGSFVEDFQSPPLAAIGAIIISGAKKIKDFPNYFEKCQIGIYTKNNIDLHALGNDFKEIDKYGIYSSFASNYFAGGGPFPGSPSNQVIISKNIFDKTQDAIYLNDNRNAKININNNSINWLNGGWNSVNTQQSLTGITVNNAAINNVGSLSITKNNIANLQKGITLTMQGYEGTGNTNRVQVIDNKIRFNQLQTSTVSTLHYGIGLFASRRVTIDGNDVNGDILRTTSAPATYNTQAQVELFNGIRIENSAEAWITNVKIDKVPGSLYVLGSCPNSNFWCNKFNNAIIGVRLSNAVIGNQLNLAAPYTNAATNNQWNSPLDVTRKISGNVTTVSTWYWSGGTAYNPTTFNAFGVTFANPINLNSPCGYLLLVQPPNPNTPEKRETDFGAIVNNTVSFTDHATENKLWADKYAYQKLRKNDELRVLGAADDYQYENYVTNKNNTCTGKLDQVTDYLDNSEVLISQQFNNSIITNIPANMARKQVNDIYIRSWHQGREEFTNADSTFLCDLGASDPLVYGDAVYSAQVMMKECVYNSASVSRIGNTSEEIKIKREEIAKPSVIPNPNNGIMHANVKLQKEETGELQIFNITGIMVGSYLLNEGTNDFMIDQSNLESGIYFYRITVNGLAKESKKLVIVK